MCFNKNYLVYHNENIFLVERGQYVSPDWKGCGWYKIVQPAGTKLSEVPVDHGYCGTAFPGWLNGTHPTNQGDIVNTRVCYFNTNEDNCFRHNQIQIIHCGDYFLYYLENAPSCNLRYCTQ